MNKRLAVGSGIGLVAGLLIGIILDPMFGANGTAMILGLVFGIPLGAGVAAATRKDR